MHFFNLFFMTCIFIFTFMLLYAYHYSYHAAVIQHYQFNPPEIAKSKLKVINCYRCNACILLHDNYHSEKYISNSFNSSIVYFTIKSFFSSSPESCFYFRDYFDCMKHYSKAFNLTSISPSFNSLSFVIVVCANNIVYPGIY